MSAAAAKQQQQQQQQFIVKSLHNGGDLKRFRVSVAQLSAGALLEEICAQHEGLERGRFTTKLEVKGRPALEPLGTEALRLALAAAGGEAASSVVLRLFSFDVRTVAPAAFAPICDSRLNLARAVRVSAGSAGPRGLGRRRRLARGGLDRQQRAQRWDGDSP